MKEIVITKKSGITLNTKKTLVDDDIKIKIDKSILKEESKGKIEITTTDEVDVSGYETAQVVDENLEPQNIAKDVNILGVVGTYEGGSSGTPIELATSEEMEAVLVAENIGKIYKFVGETNETFTNGNLYQVMEVE